MSSMRMPITVLLVLATAIALTATGAGVVAGAGLLTLAAFNIGRLVPTPAYRAGA